MRIDSRRARRLAGALAAAWLAACPEAAPEPENVVVQHILVGFQGSVPGKAISRSHGDAERLAQTLLERAHGGEDFDALVRTHTDDSHPGIYRLANHGLPPRRALGEYARGEMVPGFGDVAFSLAVGSVGIARHHERASPFGWHVIKRIE